MTNGQRRMIEILAGCPTGATAGTLALHGISEADMLAAATQGHAKARVARYSNPRDLVIVWFDITPEGRAAITGG